MVKFYWCRCTYCSFLWSGFYIQRRFVTDQNNATTGAYDLVSWADLEAALGKADLVHTGLPLGTSSQDTLDDPISGQTMVPHTFRAAAASQIRPDIYAAGGTGHLDAL